METSPLGDSVKSQSVGCMLHSSLSPSVEFLVLLIHLFNVFFTCQVAIQPIATEYLLCAGHYRLREKRKKEKILSQVFMEGQIHIYAYT